MKIPVILSFDLSFNGDYEGMYKWLDKHEAMECGDSVCRLVYESMVEQMKTFGDSQALIREIQKDLMGSVNFGRNDRVYLTSVFKLSDGTDRLAGLFIIGQRKPNPWAGYAKKEHNLDNLDQ